MPTEHPGAHAGRGAARLVPCRGLVQILHGLADAILGGGRPMRTPRLRTLIVMAIVMVVVMVVVIVWHW